MQGAVYSVIGIKPHVKLLVAAILLVSSLPAWAQSPTGSVLLENVRLIDGTGAAPLDRASILIRSGKIAHIYTRTSAPAASAQTRVMHLAGKTVIPAFINGHGHLGLTQGTSVSPDNYTPENIEHQLAQ